MSTIKIKAATNVNQEDNIEDRQKIFKRLL